MAEMIETLVSKNSRSRCAMRENTAREYRMGWRLTSADPGDPGFEIGLDATRREAANDNEAEHGVMLKSSMRW